MSNYLAAGVDREAGYRAVELMREKVRSTFTPQVLTDLGSFGGLFAFESSKYQNPVLVSGTDGVGTKLKVAFMADRHDTVGIDLVAMCVNDVLAQGATPLFFLDYLATGRVDPEKVATVIGGIAEGCKQASCALIGGETAEMPGFYGEGEYDLAGFCVGVVEKEKIIDGSSIESGDVLLGLPSSGLHSNGYSLVRKLLFEQADYSVDSYVHNLGCTLADELLKPTRIYVKPVRSCFPFGVKGIAHITGGGFYENIPRCLSGTQAVIRRGSWQEKPIFSLLKTLGGIDDEEMFSTFNMGIGMVLIVREEAVDPCLQELLRHEVSGSILGRITTSSEKPKVIIESS